MENLFMQRRHVSVCHSGSTLCRRGTFSVDWFIERAGVSEDSCRKAFFDEWWAFDIEYWNRQENDSSDGPGSRFPFGELGLLCSLKIAVVWSRVAVVSPRLGAPDRSRTWFLFGSCWGDGWWREQTLGDWLWGSWQEIKLHFWWMIQQSLLESSASWLTSIWLLFGCAVRLSEYHTELECSLLSAVIVKICGHMWLKELLVLLLRKHLLTKA